MHPRTLAVEFPMFQERGFCAPCGKSVQGCTRGKVTLHSVLDSEQCINEFEPRPHHSLSFLVVGLKSLWIFNIRIERAANASADQYEIAINELENEVLF